VITCKQAARLICEYLEGSLPSSTETGLRRHLGHCHNCNFILETAQRTLEVYFDRCVPAVAPAKPQVA
jgi:hypothetical protein